MVEKQNVQCNAALSLSTVESEEKHTNKKQTKLGHLLNKRDQVNLTRLFKVSKFDFTEHLDATDTMFSTACDIKLN